MSNESSSQLTGKHLTTEIFGPNANLSSELRNTSLSVILKRVELEHYDENGFGRGRLPGHTRGVDCASGRK